MMRRTSYVRTRREPLDGIVNARMKPCLIRRITVSRPTFHREATASTEYHFSGSIMTGTPNWIPQPLSGLPEKPRPSLRQRRVHGLCPSAQTGKGDTKITFLVLRDASLLNERIPPEIRRRYCFAYGQNVRETTKRERLRGLTAVPGVPHRPSPIDGQSRHVCMFASARIQLQ